MRVRVAELVTGLVRVTHACAGAANMKLAEKLAEKRAAREAEERALAEEVERIAKQRSFLGLGRSGGGGGAGALSSLLLCAPVPRSLLSRSATSRSSSWLRN